MRKKWKLTQPQMAILSLSIKPMSMNFLQHTQIETSKQTQKETSTNESFIIAVVD